jgi:L-malate glycosyltransferase
MNDRAPRGFPAPVLFTHWGDEAIRGSERVLLDLLARVDRDLFEPILWCNAHAMADAARSLRVETRVSRMPILFGWESPKLDVAGFRSLIREGESLIRQYGVRVVHANSGAPNQWMVPATRRARIPLLAHLHAIYGFKERTTLLLHQVPAIVGCSTAVIRPFRLDGIPESRLRVIHNGVDPKRLGAGEARGLRRSLGVAQDALLIVSVGALIRLKGFDIVIKALQVIRTRGVDAHLAIVGDGPEHDALQSLAAELGLRDRVHFLGPVNTVGAILRDAADVVAIASSVESFGLVAAEAGAVGRTVVATRVGGITEIVEDHITGLLVPAGDHAAFADALTLLAGNPSLRQALGDRAAGRVLSRFTSDRAASSFFALYTELIARSRDTFGWSGLGFRVAPFARLGLAVVGRRLGARIADV